MISAFQPKQERVRVQTRFILCSGVASSRSGSENEGVPFLRIRAVIFFGLRGIFENCIKKNNVLEFRLNESGENS